MDPHLYWCSAAAFLFCFVVLCWKFMVGCLVGEGRSSTPNPNHSPKPTLINFSSSFGGCVYKYTKTPCTCHLLYKIFPLRAVHLLQFSRNGKSSSFSSTFEESEIDPRRRITGNYKEELMSPYSVSNTGTALEGVHGVQLVPQSPFAIKSVSQCGDFHQSTFEGLDNEASQRLSMQKMWQQRPACLRPIRGCLHGDRSIMETVANVLTSLPFVYLGIQAPRKNLDTKLYANSLIGVGVASSLYHSSRGEVRRYMRWADYTMIATATVCLSRALRDENPTLLTAASALFLPIQPLMVSAVHTGLMELAFAKRAFKKPELRMAHNVHKMSSVLGGVLFFADDLFPETPYIHAAWHLAAAVGVSTCNKLLE